MQCIIFGERLLGAGTDFDLVSVGIMTFYKDCLELVLILI
jgi:hypothetical protein